MKNTIHKPHGFCYVNKKNTLENKRVCSSSVDRNLMFKAISV